MSDPRPKTPAAPETDGAPTLEPSATRGHDQLLKTLLEVFFFDLLRLVIPEFAERVDPDGIRPLDKEVFTAIPEGRRREVDLLMRVPVHDGPPELVLVHVEIEGRFRSGHPARMVRYYFQLKAKYPKNPIVPIALFIQGGPKGIDVLEWTETVDRLEICHFRYHAFGLSRSVAEDYLAKKIPLASALAALMRPQDLERWQQKLECLRQIVAYGLDDARTFLLGNLVETYLELTGHDAERYSTQDDDSNKEIHVMKLTWGDKKELEGHEKGLAEGLTLGARQTLLGMLEHRFGPLPDAVRGQIEKLDDPAEIQTLATRVVDADSLAELGFDG